jgi:hypothetical protein
MSVNNTALLFNLAMQGFLVNDGNIAQGSTQASAIRINGDLIRIVGGATNSGLLLPSVLSCEAAWITFIVNDGPNTVKIYCAPGENQNGVANAALSIPAGQAGVFSPILNSKGGTINWSSAVMA